MKMGMTTRSAGEPSAELLTWDSEFWGVRIAKAPTLMDDWALDNTIGCLWLLIPASEQAEIHRAEQNGARVMDIRVALDWAEGPLPYRAWMNVTDDIEPLVPLARTAFRGLTRFYADPRFPDERCDDLYENWLRTSHAAGDTVLIGPSPTIRGPSGFVLVHIEGHVASIVLIAVAEWARGRGVGVGLVNSALMYAHREGCSQMTVVTQGCNIPAQRTFQKCGFRVFSTDVWLHSWFYDA